jgi:hypothetical protein
MSPMIRNARRPGQIALSALKKGPAVRPGQGRGNERSRSLANTKLAPKTKSDLCVTEYRSSSSAFHAEHQLCSGTSQHQIAIVTDYALDPTYTERHGETQRIARHVQQIERPQIAIVMLLQLSLDSPLPPAATCPSAN